MQPNIFPYRTNALIDTAFSEENMQENLGSANIIKAERC
jgi:hypothetical protein